MNKTIVLFDMDGTLTEPRQAFDFRILEPSLRKLAEYADIGIITGSDEDYLREQMESFLYDSNCRYQTHLMPCNGTKYLKPPTESSGDFVLAHEVSMEGFLGTKDYRELICELIYSQIDMCHMGAPMTGHFINCRGSMINWSPIGRNANSLQREEFIKMDKEKGIRSRCLEELRAMLKMKNLLNKVVIKLGGDTSFDIYPIGWDKTYGLRHFDGWNVWFVGDRCRPNGNDYELYSHCNLNNQGFITTNPVETASIIEQIIEKLKNRSYNDS